MRPEAKAGYAVGELQKIDEAHKLLTEAKTILDDPNVRSKMKADSYLGELSDLGCYKQALQKAQTGVDTLQALKRDVEPHKVVVDSITKKIDEITKPEPEKEVIPEPESEVQEVPTEPEKEVIPEFYGGEPKPQIKRKRSRKKAVK